MIELTDGVVVARPPTIEDAPAMHEAARSSWREIGRWMDWCREDLRLEESQAWIEQATIWSAQGFSREFFLFDRDDGRLLGACGLNQVNIAGRRANLGYWVRTSETGRGIASRAVRLVARYGFAEMGLVRLEIVAVVGNDASRRVAQKVGATEEGVLRNRVIYRGKPYDAWMFSLVPGDLDG